MANRPGIAKRRALCAVLATVVVGVALRPAAARPGPADVPGPSISEPVAFRTLDPRVGGLIPGTLFVPAGAGPFPAVVLLHGCGGIGAATYGWAAWLSIRGYAALVVDSMPPRHARSVCVVGGRPTMADQARDAYGALVYLRSRAGIDPARIGVMGWSHGGGATQDAHSLVLRVFAEHL